MRNKFAERLSELLKVNDITKRAFAAAIHVSAMSVSDWSNGNVQPTAENIYLTAVYFKVSADYLLGLEGDAGNIVY